MEPKKEEKSMDKISKYWKYAKAEYKLLKVLGAGTFGQVVFGKHRVTKKEVAIKFIKGDLDSHQRIRNLIRELSILRQLTAMKGNFFTTKLHDVILANKPDKPLKECKGLFLVLDYVPDDLKKMLDDISPGDFQEDHIKVIMYNILCSINFISSANLMHRDIKP